MINSLEVCSGAGGQALGLEQAGFEHEALVEMDRHACATLRANRPTWNVVEGDLKEFNAEAFLGIDLLAGGVPCPPFSKAGKQLGANDERDLFPTAVSLVDQCRPNAIMLENVRGLLDGAFNEYRANLNGQLDLLGYTSFWKLLHASDFGVSQLRPRVVLVALKGKFAEHFEWPVAQARPPLSVGELLYDLMKSGGWLGADNWKIKANSIAPTLVGGSKKHGGPDLGPTRARKAWAQLGVDGIGIWNEAPEENFEGMPRLTTRMAARIQGFPDDWLFSGGKTASYRQIGNAFPPPVACAIGKKIKMSFEKAASLNVRGSKIRVAA